MVYSFSCLIVVLEMSENYANGPADIDLMGEWIQLDCLSKTILFGLFIFYCFIS